MVTKLNTVTAAPGAAALMEGIRDFGYWLGAALADIIDNSITKHASVVEVETNMFDASPSILIKDNGVGMSATELRAAMVLGSQDPRAPRDKRDLGRFGLGLKTASFSQCRRLTVVTRANETAHAALETEVFGKRVLVTDHDLWPVTDVVAAYRSQSDAEFSFRQLKDPHVVSFSPMHHWTEHNIRVHTFTCVLALQIAHLMRRQAEHAGLHMSVRDLLDQLAGIEETVLIYPSTGGRPKARRMLTQTTPTQDQLTAIFNLTAWAPKS